MTGPRTTKAVARPWLRRRLDEVAAKIQDGTHFSPRLGGWDYRYVTSKNIGFGRLTSAKVETISEIEHRKIYGRCDVRHGDLLLTKDGANTGNAAINPFCEEISLLSSVAFLRFDPAKHMAQFFLQYLLSEEAQAQIHEAMVGNAITRLTLAKIGALTVPVPSLAEQRRIAEVLSDTDELIGSLERLIAKKRDIRQGTAQQLLTGRTRLLGFEGRWEESSIDEVAEVDPESLGAETPASYEFDYIYLEGVEKGVLRAFSRERFATAPSRARRVVRDGDVLMSMVRPSLKSHLHFRGQVDQPVCSTGFAVIRARPKRAEPSFLFNVVMSQEVQRQVERITAGSNYPAISAADVRGLRLPVPLVDEQRAIAGVLTDMDAEAEALDARLGKTRGIKQGMMQELLTGRTRLPIPAQDRDADQGKETSPTPPADQSAEGEVEEAGAPA
jgi:type I restriction enzyme S subunit